jgi:hypothetical protein
VTKAVSDIVKTPNIKDEAKFDLLDILSGADLGNYAIK